MRNLRAADMTGGDRIYYVINVARKEDVKFAHRNL